MVFLLPGAHAASSATVVLSTTSTTNGVVTELSGVTSGAVGSALVITGSGFASGAPIEIYSTVGTSSVTWLDGNVPNTCAGAFGNAYGGIGNGNSLLQTTGTGPCLMTLANGYFKTTVTVPALPGGAETIVVSDGTNSVSTSFTITSSVSFSKTGTNYGFPDESIAGTLAVTGFGPGETITITTPMWSTNQFTCLTGTTPQAVKVNGVATTEPNTGAGSCTVTVPNTTYIIDQTGGSKSISATGGTSGDTASTSFTVNAWAAFYNSAKDLTSFSFLGNAPTSLIVEVHGATAGTITAGSVTVAGISTQSNSYTVGSSGIIYGLVVSPTSNVPFGNVAIVVQGNTFSYSKGNIVSGAVTPDVIPAPNGAIASAPWGGAIISSVIGTTATSTGIASMDQTNYKPGIGFTASSTNPAPAQNQQGIFGYGFVPATACSGAPAGGTIGITAQSPANFLSGPTLPVGNQNGGVVANSADCNGAFFAATTLGDTPWSLAASPTTAMSYSATVVQQANAPANVLSPSFGITAWDTIGASGVNFLTNAGDTFTGHGFSQNEVLTATIGGSALLTGGTCAGTTGLTGTCVTAAGSVPDLAAGGQTVVLTGGISGVAVTTSSGVTYSPAFVGTAACTTTCATNIQSGAGGSTTIIRTSSGALQYGVHGLSANTGYTIEYNPVLPGTAAPSVDVLGTFTSTATGGIPVPGVQVTIPNDVAGLHVISIVPTTAVSAGTSEIFGNTGGLVPPGDYVDTDVQLALVTNTQSQYGDMLFNEQTTLTATPTAALVGQSVSVSGTGLAGSTLYDLGVSQAGTGNVNPAAFNNAPTTCSLTGVGPAAAPSTIAGQFTSTSTGSVPASTSLTLSDMPTVKGLELGTLYCIYAQTASNFGGITYVGVAQFELQASETVSAATGQVGTNVVLTAHGLAATTGYNIIFAPYTTIGGAVIGTVAGAILTNAQGAGSGTFTIPSTIQTASGVSQVVSGQSYAVELQLPTVPAGANAVAIASPVLITIGSTSTSCNTTSCVTASGSSTIASINGQKTVETSFTNNSNAPVTAIVYAVVHNSAGQTVAYDTATITAASGASATAYNVLYGLAPGSYTVTIFVTSTSGTAISAITTVTVTSP